MKDDATNRVTFDYCEIMHKNISSSSCVKKDSTGQVTCLKLDREGGGGTCWLMISAKLLLQIFKTKDDAALAPHTALQIFKLV